MKIAALVLSVMVSLSALDAEAARRMGGGKSMGKQSAHVTQREQAANPAQKAPASTAPNASAAKAPATATAAGAATAAKPRTPWGGILGGVAAGLGLAWLASSLGLGEGFGQILLLLLSAMVGMTLWRMWRARSAVQGAAGLAGAGTPMGKAGAMSPADIAAMAKNYNPVKVGNDASARPWETGQELGGNNKAASASVLTGSQNWGIPAGFDTAGFIESAKRNFVLLQKAWDEGDVATLRTLLSDDMLAQVRQQLQDRSHAGQTLSQHTEVIKLEAQLLGIEDVGDAYMASVEFSGLVSESAFAAPESMREVWNMTKSKDGQSGWLVAGVQNFNA